MTHIHTLEEKAVQAFIVFDVPEEGHYNEAELVGLVTTLKFEVCGSLVLTKREPTAQYALGSGKAAEIAHKAKEMGADCIVFDFEIQPTQQRNWEKLAEIPVYDREEIILRIFASRARTKEAVLQVECARLQYALPRLAHTYGDMARQRGGNYGSRGSGETQLELDRRAILHKIGLIKEELAKVIKERTTQRKKRSRVQVPSVALVGYTNAGKSSLLNALTGESVFVENALFATLDPTTRKMSLSGGCEIVLTDTVGFIRKLPHTLVDSFRATLEEVCSADMLITVLDASDMHFETQYETTLEVLNEIGAGEKTKLILFNKVDALSDNHVQRARVEAFSKQFESDSTDDNKRGSVLSVSAHTGNGLDAVRDHIRNMVSGTQKAYRIPLEHSSAESLIRRTGIVYATQWDDESVSIIARTFGKTEQLLRDFEIPLSELSNLAEQDTTQAE